MNYKEIANFLEEKAQESYEELIKGIILFERKAIEKDFLDKIYENYMENDEIDLLNEDLFNIR